MFVFRAKVDRGLSELSEVIPAGETYMHEGMKKVKSHTNTQALTHKHTQALTHKHTQTLTHKHTSPHPYTLKILTRVGFDALEQC